MNKKEYTRKLIETNMKEMDLQELINITILLTKNHAIKNEHCNDRVSQRNEVMKRIELGMWENLLDKETLNIR